jgi:hypothetical protein
MSFSTLAATQTTLSTIPDDVLAHMSYPAERSRVSASLLGSYFRDNCQLHLRRKAHKAEIPGINTGAAMHRNVATEPPPLQAAIMARGNAWEARLWDEILANAGCHPVLSYQCIDATGQDAVRVLQAIRSRPGSTVIVYHLKANTPVFEGNTFQQAVATAAAAGFPVNLEFG